MAEKWLISSTCTFMLSSGILGGLKKISSTKELNDVEKLYENLPKLLENILESKQKRVFCARFYSKINLLLTLRCAHSNVYAKLDEYVYFDQLIRYRGSYLVSDIVVSIIRPSTSHHLLYFTNKVSLALKWRDVVMEQALSLSNKKHTF